MKPRNGFRDARKTIDFGKTLLQILKKRLIKKLFKQITFHSLTLCGKVLRKMMRTSLIRKKKNSAWTIFSRKKKRPETGNLKPVSLDFFLFKLFFFSRISFFGASHANLNARISDSTKNFWSISFQ